MQGRVCACRKPGRGSGSRPAPKAPGKSSQSPALFLPRGDALSGWKSVGFAFSLSFPPFSSSNTDFSFGKHSPREVLGGIVNQSVKRAGTRPEHGQSEASSWGPASGHQVTIRRDCGVVKGTPSSARPVCFLHLLTGPGTSPSAA